MKPGFSVAIVGVGQVGGAVASALIPTSIATELLLVDVKPDLLDAQVRDLSDVAFSSKSATRVKATHLHEAGQCDMVIVTAGSKFNIGLTNLQLFHRNVSTVKTIITGMRPFKHETILLIVSNPVDLLTSIALKLSGLPESQVLGTGTFLDSVRLRGLIADKLGVALSWVDAYILGEHGDEQVVAWSTAKIDGVPAENLLSPEVRNTLAKECKRRSEDIIRAKGSVVYGLGSVIADISLSIALDKRLVSPISHFLPNHKCCMSLPVILGRQGIEGTVEIPLDRDTETAMASAAKEQRKALDRMYESW